VKCVNGDLHVGDVILSNDVTEYVFLVGRVLSIEEGYPKDQLSRRVFADLSSNYSNKRTREIADDYSHFNYEATAFNEIDLSCVRFIGPENKLAVIGGDEIAMALKSRRNAHYLYSCLTKKIRLSWSCGLSQPP